jgi:hypothetical protein
MKRINTLNRIKGALRGFTLCLGVIAAVLLGTGLPANAAITYGFTETSPVDPVASQEGWTKIYPTTGDLWANYGSWGWMPDDGHLGAGWEDANTILARSPDFTLDGSGDLTFQLLGSASPLAAPDVAPSAIPEAATTNGGFMGVALRDVATDTYVLSRVITTNNYNTWTDLSFTDAELDGLIAANPGAKYTLDFIDYSKFVGPTGADGWIILGGASIPGVLYSHPANDNFANAIDLPGPTGTQTGTDNINAYLEAGELGTVTYPDSSTSLFTNTVWFKWTCAENGDLTVSTLGSTDPLLVNGMQYLASIAGLR